MVPWVAEALVKVFRCAISVRKSKIAGPLCEVLREHRVEDSVLQAAARSKHATAKKCAKAELKERRELDEHMFKFTE